MRYHEIILIEKMQREVDASDVPYFIFSDPNGAEFKTALERSRHKLLRGLIAADHLYVWDGYAMDHRGMTGKLGLPDSCIRLVIRQIAPMTVSVIASQQTPGAIFAEPVAVTDTRCLQYALKAFTVQ